MVKIRVDVTQTIMGADGTTPLAHQRIEPSGEVVDITEADGSPKPFTLRNGISRAITGILPGAESEARDHPPEIKDDLFRVLCLVAANDTPELDDADRILILERSKVLNGFIVHGRIGEAFEAGERVVKNPKANGAGKVLAAT